MATISCTGEAGQFQQKTIDLRQVYVKGECPTGWIHFGDSCFYFSDLNLDWLRAESSCRSHNARLAEIANKAQSDFLITEAKRLGGPGYWLGGRDDIVEGSWVWVSTDTPFSYTAWAPGQPNGSRNENCVHIFASLNWLWNDAPCTYPSYRYICEKEYPEESIIG